MQFNADGVRNTSITWIEATLPATKSIGTYTIKVTINGQEKKLTATDFRFDGLKDNTTYPALIEASNGSNTYQKTVQVTIPNRTAPNAEDAYLQSSKLILEITSNVPIKSK
ncbi:hypothetical protein EEL31_23140 [Brevibacillus laterosporus]|nr:hypothetical protein [Brevibacillus laterosporus]TPG71039.1 hypothetical protein EEL31_23140 [Brevibacillus laterosporus]